MATTAEIQTRLTEAEAALHALAMGQRVQEVWKDGKKMVFTQANAGQLRAYITSLKADLLDAQALSAGLTRRRVISLGWKN